MGSSNTAALVCPGKREFDALPAITSAERIIEFYDKAGMDYEHWSKGFNMHLGFYRLGLNPFDREKMLEQMNLEIAARLGLDPKGRAFLVDLGCGLGAIARFVAKTYSSTIIKAITNVPSQAAEAARLNEAEDVQNRIEILHGDYAALPFEDGAVDGVWAVESACYAEGGAKENLVREMARVLKAGGRFVIADCFIRRPEKRFGFLMGKCYRAACRNWALSEMPTLDLFVAALKRHNFRDIVVEDISWRVAPSVAHAPFAVLSFIIKKILSGERLNQQSVNNVKASLLAFALGLNRKKISYCLVRGLAGGRN
jgi:MPBQ/MSBQ methyltransferase